MSLMSDKPYRCGYYDEIRPLIKYCKDGNLAEVQAWIRANNPVNPPPLPEKGHRPLTPLQVAIDVGFLSIVQALLEAGAIQEPSGNNSPMDRALAKRRVDIIKLLVDHGFEVRDINMCDVFDTWDPELMEYFIDRGAEIEKGNPFAYAFCHRIRTAIGPFKKCLALKPSLIEQANIALRHQCKEGKTKWISLLLWVGADALAPGNDKYDDDEERPDDGLCALGYAALYEHFEIFKLKQLQLDMKHSSMPRVVAYLCKKQGTQVLKTLLNDGLNPNDQENGGSSAIQQTLEDLSWEFSLYSSARDRNIDSSESKEKIKAIHILARYGAKWVPHDRSQINNARKSLLKMTPDYAMEFVWIMSKYQGCCSEDIRALVTAPTIRSHLEKHRSRLEELLVTFQKRDDAKAETCSSPVTTTV